MKLKREIPYLRSRIEDLPDTDRNLIRLAREACKTAYAPYSGFRVGAAAVLNDGTLLGSSNQESEVFPSGMCAERVLLYTIQSGYPGRQVVSVAIAAEQYDALVREEVYPCGGCAQVFLDTEKRQHAPIRILMTGAESCSIIESSRHLLPFSFEFKK